MSADGKEHAFLQGDASENILKDAGTGLGLWVAQETASKHGGSIEIESRTGDANHGTTFRVTLGNSCDRKASAQSGSLAA